MFKLQFRKSIPNIDSQTGIRTSEDFVEGFADFWVSLRAKKDNSQTKQKILKPENENYVLGWFTAWGISESFQEKSEMEDLANSGYGNGYKLGEKLKKYLAVNSKLNRGV